MSRLGVLEPLGASDDRWVRVIENRFAVARPITQSSPVRGTRWPVRLVDEHLQRIGLDESLENHEPAYVGKTERLPQDPGTATVMELSFQGIEVRVQLRAA